MTKTAKTNSIPNCRAIPTVIYIDGSSSKRAKKAASPRRCQGKPPNSEPACLSWADLRPELVSHVARYVSPDTADMMSFLFCVGPKVATIVRTTYLTGNDEYLRECILDAPPYHSRGFIKRRTRILVWMKYNDWRDRCVLSGKHVVTVSFEKELLNEFVFNNLGGSGLVCCGPSFEGFEEISRLHQEGISRTVGKAYQDYCRAAIGVPIILGIGDREIPRGTTAEQVRAVMEETIQNSDERTILIDLKIGRFVDIAFSHSKVFIGLGLDSVLKYHLDKGLLKPNSTVKGAPFVSNKGDMPLLWQAIQEPGGFCFRYLLTLSDINVAGRNDDATTDGYRLLHIAAGYMDMEWIYDRLKSLLDHPLVDPNVVSDNGLTPLHCICFSRRLTYEQKLARIRLFLERGANPSTEGLNGQTLIDDLEYLSTSDQFTQMERERFRELMHALIN